MGGDLVHNVCLTHDTHYTICQYGLDLKVCLAKVDLKYVVFILLIMIKGIFTTETPESSVLMVRWFEFSAHP